MEEDYSVYEGKDVTFIGEDESIVCTVVGCDYDVGITIIVKEDKRYIFCMAGKVSTDLKMYFFSPSIYNAFFFFFIKAFKLGYVNTCELIELFNEHLGGRYDKKPDASKCAFN